MISSKQRARLRGMANGLDALFQIGKGGVTDAVIRQTDEALTARELIKLSVLETAPQGAKEAAQLVADATSADIVQVIGSKFVLYRRNDEKPGIVL